MTPLERAELLTPTTDGRALEQELRYQGTRGRFDHVVEVLEDGVEVIATPLMLGVQELEAQPPRELAEGPR